jgi:DUF2075 family protein
MIVYSSTKQEFINAVNDSPIEDVILNRFEDKLKRTTGQSEIESWRDSLPYMSQVLSDDSIPKDAGVLIEYMIQHSAFRVDFIITGLSNEGKENVVIVELKRWSAIEITDKDGIVKTSFKGMLQETSHPSYQAWSYAAFLSSFNETIYNDDISLRPCAYLHNYYIDDKLNNTFYQDYLNLAPVFLKKDKSKLREFIKQYVQKGDTHNMMYRIEHSKIKPSKALAESLASMLKGNQEFIMLDDQKVVLETAISGAKKSTNERKNVLIVEGGPGTGKSVVAINLLVSLTKLGKVAKYVTKNSAPRTVYKAMLSKSMKGGDIDFFFTGSGSFTETAGNTYDVLIVDEAHRLNAKSGMFSNLGENQIKEIIHSSKFSVFFIDEDQKVTTKDIGSMDEIRKWAKFHNANIREMKLNSQFRCNGSDAYLAWLDNTLQIKPTANIDLSKSDYNFNIVDSPAEMRDIIYKLNEENNKARMIAGYCWDWKSKTNPQANDIEFLEYDFSHQWNLANDGMKWIISKDSVKEIGCIHTSQGLELEHVGVIVGKDLIVRDNKIITNFRERSSMDKSMSGIIGLHNRNPQEAYELADKLIKNTYRTLFTRGMKSCTVYFVDEKTREYFKERLN